MAKGEQLAMGTVDVVPSISFTVYGTPVPQGSMKAFLRPGSKFPVVTSDNKKLKPWRQEVTLCAMKVFRAPVLKPRALWVNVLFFLSRPPSKSVKIEYPGTKPDIDKLLRGVLDALTGVAYEDDSQICRVSVQKNYGRPERAEITVGVIG
ncbi:MAG TPA: RusA family crossover junction endodeoxyribonuclease [Verrucomicrobiae bacterium]|nr:RusA family crossover junction endodeoxyribonuclease [Verrucomicrobiae bacterium]